MDYCCSRNSIKLLVSSPVAQTYASPATTFTYDALGRLLTTTDPLNRTTTLTYDVAGNVATSKDVRDRITTFEYDAKNRPKKVCDPLLEETSYTYDGNDNLLTRVTQKRRPSGSRTMPSTNCSRRSLPGSLVTGYAYDLVGNLTSVTAPASALTMTYDLANRVLTTSPAVSSDQPSVNVTTPTITG